MSDSNTDTERMSMQSELLCFIVDKRRYMTVDDIVKICADFYKEDEIVAARVLLDHCVSGHRLPKRQGMNRVRATLEDIVKLLLTPTVELPVFYAVEISRLPPVDVVHCDVAAILKELMLLRQEVRAVGQLREEVAQLKLTLDAQSAKPSLAAPATSVCSTMDDSSAAVSTPSYAVMAQNLEGSGLDKPALVRKTVRPTVGTSKSYDKLKAVTTTRVVDLFVTRLHPATCEEEIMDCIKSANGGDQPVDIKQLNCTKLKSKFEALYSSYHVAIRVDAGDLMRAVDLFMSSQVWPVGIMVRRYFKPRNGSKQQANN